MNRIDERALIVAVERSAVFRAVERVAKQFGLAAPHSSALAAGQAVIRAAVSHAGVALLAAVLTHVLLMSVVSRPAFWYWLILPSLFAAAGIILIILGPHRLRRE